MTQSVLLCTAHTACCHCFFAAGSDAASNDDCRWQRVAALVPGKTRAQCQKRFRELKNDFRAKKEATS